ncbi:TetR/AcrR family transcriptional regulator [Paraburkholderia fungorum]|uniref:TetR/AcrR family transcriptional regulator n=1 Tax=Paraburkholderia fungorum TaxID=134537 RepID=UPI0038BB7DA0
MRYDAHRKDQTRQQIVEAAARRFRGEGIKSVGIASLMSTVGLTHGGFYAHFQSKEDLVVEACLAAFEETLSWLTAVIEAAPPGEKVRAMMEVYLSQLHRDHMDRGCFAAALAPEVTRMTDPVRQTMSDCLAALEQLASQAIQADGSDLSPKAVLAMMVGALSIARVVPNGRKSEDYLGAVRNLIAANIWKQP